MGRNEPWIMRKSGPSWQCMRLTGLLVSAGLSSYFFIHQPAQPTIIPLPTSPTKSQQITALLSWCCYCFEFFFITNTSKPCMIPLTTKNTQSQSTVPLSFYSLNFLSSLPFPFFPLLHKKRGVRRRQTVSPRVSRDTRRHTLTTDIIKQRDKWADQWFHHNVPVGIY